MEEMKYINANMIVWLDETGSDRRNECRKREYHLRGVTLTDFLSFWFEGSTSHPLALCLQEELKMLICVKEVLMVIPSVTSLKAV